MCILEINQDSQFDILPRIYPWEDVNDSKIKGKVISCQWTVSYKNSFFVKRGTIRLVENMRPEN